MSRIHIVRRDECRPSARPVRPWATRLTHPRPTAPTRATRGIKAVIPVKTRKTTSGTYHDLQDTA